MMMSRISILCLIIGLFACKTVTPPVIETSTPGGEVYRIEEVPHTIEDDTLPAGLEIGDVIASVTVQQVDDPKTPENESASPSKVIIVKKKKSSVRDRVMGRTEVEAYVDNNRVSTMKVEQPKGNWWEWPVIIVIYLLSLVSVAVAVYFFFINVIRRK